MTPGLIASRARSSPATFDYAKLDWMNGVYLRQLSSEDYAGRLLDHLREQGVDWPAERVRAAAPLVQAKIGRLGEFLRVERISIFEVIDNRGTIRMLDSWAAPGFAPLPGSLDTAQVPYAVAKLLRGEDFVVPRIEDLPVPLAITAYDLTDGTTVAITRGRVVDAIQRAIAVPLFFPPCPDGEHLWCDAGPWEAMPVSIETPIQNRSTRPLISMRSPSTPGNGAVSATALRKWPCRLALVAEAGRSRSSNAAAMAVRSARAIVSGTPSTPTTVTPRASGSPSNGLGPAPGSRPNGRGRGWQAASRTAAGSSTARISERTGRQQADEEKQEEDDQVRHVAGFPYAARAMADRQRP